MAHYRWALSFVVALACTACGSSRADDADAPTGDTGQSEDTELNLFRKLAWSFEGAVPHGTAVFSSVGSEGGLFKNTDGKDKTFFSAIDLDVNGSRWALDGKWRTTSITFVVGAAGLDRELGWITLVTPFHKDPEWMDPKRIIPLDGDVLRIDVVKKGANYTFATPAGATAEQTPHHFSANGPVYVTYGLPNKSAKIQVEIHLAPDVAAEVAAAAALGKSPVGPDPGGE
jgi:hypothetical protein